MEPQPGTSGAVFQQSKNTISGAQSQTVHQLLAYLANGNNDGESQQEDAVSSPKMAKITRVSDTIPTEKDNKDIQTNLTAEELFRLIMSDHHYLKMDVNAGLGCDVNKVPNAADIQKFFLETINLIAFKPIKDVDPSLASTLSQNKPDMENKKVTLNDDNRGQKLTEDAVQPSNIIEAEKERRRRERQIWASECRAVLGRVQHNSFIKHALNLLEKYWKQYLATPLEEINQQVVDSAQELNLTDDVVEMLEDKSRYVWQIIEEMPPRDLQLPF